MLILLTAPVWGFPERRDKVERPRDVSRSLPKLAQQLHEKKENKIRETQRDCKGKCATSIAQKAAAEAKAAQAAQNAAGAQASHMASVSLNSF